MKNDYILHFCDMLGAKIFNMIVNSEFKYPNYDKKTHILKIVFEENQLEVNMNNMAVKDVYFIKNR